MSTVGYCLEKSYRSSRPAAVVVFSPIFLNTFASRDFKSADTGVGGAEAVAAAFAFGVAAGAGVFGAVGRVKESAQHVWAQQKPMSEILDASAYARPVSFGDATSRMQKNLNYFRINYLVFASAVLSLFVLFHPSSLAIFGSVAAAWVYVFSVRSEPLKIGDRELSHRETLMGMSALSAFVIFMLTSAGTVLFSGLGVALLGVGAHAFSLDYALTALGKSLCNPVAQLGNWAIANIGKVEAARAVFDSEQD